MPKRTFSWSENYRDVDTDPLELLKRVGKRLRQRHRLFSTIYGLLRPTPEYQPVLLEVASGMGIESNLFSLLGFRSFAVDFNHDALEYALRARRFLSGRTVISRGDAYRLPFRDNTCDCVFSQGFLEHFADEKVVELVREQARVLRPGGYLVIDVPSRYSAYSLYKLRFEAAGGWLYGFERQFSQGQLKRFAAGACPGMAHVGTYGWSFLGYPVSGPFDYVVMAPLLLLRALMWLFGAGHDSICAVFRKPGA